MRIDCYNATECPVSSVEYGDTFYFDSKLHMRCRLGMNIGTNLEQRWCYIVSLDVGEIKAVEPDTQVIMADTKIVANTRDTF